MLKYFFIFLSLSISSSIAGQLPEMVIGQERIDPGINLIFEGAIKDDVFPSSNFVPKENSDVHFEVLANWNDDAPTGSPVNGFVAYLRITAEIKNQRDSVNKIITLLPHINLSDNLHYALNTKLPGKRDDLYSVKFTIQPPASSELGLHFDWMNEVGSFLAKPYTFEYKDLDFSEIANSKRR